MHLLEAEVLLVAMPVQWPLRRHLEQLGHQYLRGEYELKVLWSLNMAIPQKHPLTPFKITQKVVVLLFCGHRSLKVSVQRCQRLVMHILDTSAAGKFLGRDLGERPSLVQVVCIRKH